MWRCTPNELAAGELREFVNSFGPGLKLKSKEHTGTGKVRRTYHAPLTPYARILASAQVTEEKKAKLGKLKAINRMRRALE